MGPFVYRLIFDSFLKVGLYVGILFFLTQCTSPPDITLNNPYDPESDSFISFSRLKTLEAGSITRENAIVKAVFLEDFGRIPVRKGICWARTPNPSLSDQCTNEGGGFGSGRFSSNLTDLEMTTQYYARSYYENEDTTVFGNQIEFITDN